MKHNGSFAKMSSRRTIKYRNAKNIDTDKFRLDLTNTPCTFLKIHERLQLWNKMFISVVDKHAPFVTKRVKVLQQPPWWNNNIQSAMCTRDKLLQQFNQCRDETSRLAYTYARNKINYMIRAEKHEFYTKTLHDNVHDSKAMWKTIRSAMNITTSIGPKLNKESDDSTQWLKANDIADNFNNHFTSVGEKYRPDCNDSTMSENHKLLEFVNQGNQSNDTFRIPPMSDTFVFDQLYKMANSKSTGLDGICINVLKVSADIIAPHIAVICFSSGTEPALLENVRVVPIFKGGDTNDMANYRPISVLPVLGISKMLERHVYDHYYYYLVSHNFLLDKQSCFRKHHSLPNHADKIDELFVWKHGPRYVVCSNWPKKSILPYRSWNKKKIAIYGCEESTKAWFKSCLDNIMNCVRYNGSKYLPINLGVPQGSIVGPLMFILVH